VDGGELIWREEVRIGLRQLADILAAPKRIESSSRKTMSGKRKRKPNPAWEAERARADETIRPARELIARGEAEAARRAENERRSISG
jgi:hypothetical protein